MRPDQFLRVGYGNPGISIIPRRCRIRWFIAVTHQTIMESGRAAGPADADHHQGISRDFPGSPSLQKQGKTMHEFGIAYDIFMTARKAAQDHHADSVTKVSVAIGEVSMVNPEQVEFLFGTLAEDDPVLKGAVLDYTVVPPETRCICGYEGAEKFVCPRCGALPELVRGREIMVTNIEIEVHEP
jgi:hydrogenase nickel incorporation protein HypA/HybF